jgi:BirA family biotin operon repressor/biotin-[acetyl-CoA-carboxylase] ligase
MKFDINYFRSLLQEYLFDIEIQYFDEIDSSNTYLLKKNDFGDKILVIADFQTAGRGRFNRKWISNRGENLMFSIGLKEINLSELQKFSFITPLAVQEAIEKDLNIQLKIKWPNDLIYDNKKVCGILIESQIQNNEKAKVVVGIGINVNQTNFPDEIKERTTSLKLLLNKEIKREILLSKILFFFFEHLNSVSGNFERIYQDYKNKCTGISQKVSVVLSDKIYTGILNDINKNGELELLVGDKILSFKSGEITIVKE